MHKLWNRVREGWRIAAKQPFAVITLFLYHLAWGMLLYKLIQSVVLPLLHRYPGSDLPREASRLFWIEGQFQLMKTDLLEPYLWWAAGLLALRMLLHPILSAGIIYSLGHRDLNAGYRFVEGVRELTLPFVILYAAQLLLSALPFYWLLPYAVQQYTRQPSYSDMLHSLALPLSACILYLFVLQLLFLFLQIARSERRGTLYTLIFVARQLPVILPAALLVACATLLISAAVMSAAFVWAGFAALILHQAYRLAQMFFKLWAIGTQYAIWVEKA